ncbi:MAG: hypothetical protein ABSD92_12625 [Candidatus Bathyarchaeia archaeon]
MKNLKGKTLTIMIAAILMLSIGTSTAIFPNASAHSPKWNIPTIAFINVGTNPDGVGQAVNIGFWMNEPPPTAGGPVGDRWVGMTVAVTKPDGTNETLGPFISDDTGGTHTQYTPMETGTYTFQMSFPGQTLAGANGAAQSNAFIGDYYEPAVSNIATMTVQTQPVGGVAVAPLPTSYWQTPINAMNVNNWYVIGGAWLGLGSSTGHTGMYNSSCNYNPYTTAPMSSHILWTKPEAFGGVLGGQYGGTTTYGNYYSTAQYEKKYTPVIINGYLYYNVYPGSSTTTTGLVCVDLYTGQTVWENNADNFGGGSAAYNALTTAGLVTTLMCGQILDFVSPNQYGGLAYIWTTGTPAWIPSAGYGAIGTTLNMFDAETGTYILSVVNGTSMTLAVDDTGDLIGYYVNSTAGTQIIQNTPINGITGPVLAPFTTTGPSLNMWNSTLCIETGAWGAMASGWMWRPPQNGMIPFHDGIMYSTPIPANINGAALPSPWALYCVNSGVIVTVSYSAGGGMLWRGPYTIYAGFSQATGQQLWIENLTVDPFVPQSGASCTSDQMTCGDGVWTIANYQNSILQGYSMTNGALLWSDNLVPFDPYDSIGGWMMNLAGDNLYVAGFGGDIWSINMLSGAINWYTNTTTLQGSSGTNSPYAVWPIWVFSNGAVADGVLFYEEGHEYSPPLFLGANQIAVNATNGSLVWDITAFDVDGLAVVAYGVMPILNAYDNQIYGYGMGPSATTVTAPNIGVTTSTPVTISGTVMDVSAGAKQEAVAANFPNGLPAVSDASMSQWMEHVYMQQPNPNNATGVQVTLTATDPNGNTVKLGTATSDTSGFYSLTYTPPIPGHYTVIATFAGTNSYYGSYAETAFYASGPTTTTAPAATTVTNAATTSDLMTYMTVSVIAIIIAIAIVGVLLLRKHP